MTTQHDQATAQEEHDDEDGYRGRAVLSDGEQDLEVELTLRGYFEPIDGKYHWYGRIEANEAVTTAATASRRPFTVRTPQGEADGKLSDQDPWGRFRITGIGVPPFHVDTEL